MDEQRFNQIGLNLAFVFVVIGFLFILIFWQKLPPVIPLYYSLTWGEDQLAPTFSIFILPLFSALILILNFVLNKLLKTQGLLFSFCLWTAAIVSFLSLFTLVKIVILII